MTDTACNHNMLFLLTFLCLFDLVLSGFGYMVSELYL